MLVHVEVTAGSFELLVDWVVVCLELLVDFKVKELLAIVVRIQKESFQLRYMNQNGKLVQKCRNQEASEGVVNVFAVALKIRVDLLL